MILLIDNYDSFSYNLYQLIGSVHPHIRVVRNDELSMEEIEELDVSHIILSPGPGRPEDAGICIEAVKYFAGKIPILGVCLGHQAICSAYGAEKIKAARYHSLAVREETIPEELLITARTEDGEVMAVSHRKYQVYGVQFHPESILTPDGETIIRNFLGMALLEKSK